MQKRAKKPTKMSTASWRTEVRRFCDTTSVKGVPKLMRARGPIRRALWTSCVLLGAAMATYQSYILLKVYCDFETSTSVEFINRDASFPDVTICKTNPPPDINVCLCVYYPFLLLFFSDCLIVLQITIPMIE